MTIFDAPTRESCMARRERTNTPVQALVLMNESQYFLAAKELATRVLAEAGPDHDDRIRHAYEIVTARSADQVEQQKLRRGLKAMIEI